MNQQLADNRPRYSTPLADRCRTALTGEADTRDAISMTGIARKPKAISGQRTGSPTMADIAAVAGVSKMTVSRVLRGPGGVREATRDRVIKVMKDMHYTPNRSARMLSGAHQLRFGVVYNNPRSSYIMDFLMSAFDQASLLDIQIISRGCDVGNDDAEVLRSIVSSGVDAIILTPPLCDSATLHAIVDDLDIPVLLVSSDGSLSGISSISIDEHAAARLMTDHIIGLGHRRIGFIAGEPLLAASHTRAAGYRAALDAAGLPFDPRLVVSGKFTFASGLAAAEDLLARGDPPTAIFASNDDMAAAAIMVAHRRGMSIPGRLTVCGLDDSWIATTIFPELTTIRQPIAEMAIESVTLLAELASAYRSGDRRIRRHIVPHVLVVRRSDAPPMVEDCHHSPQ